MRVSVGVRVNRSKLESTSGRLARKTPAMKATETPSFR